jgi:hypothetical protein
VRQVLEVTDQEVMEVQEIDPGLFMGLHPFVDRLRPHGRQAPLLRGTDRQAAPFDGQNRNNCRLRWWIPRYSREKIRRPEKEVNQSGRKAPTNWRSSSGIQGRNYRMWF